MARPKNVFPSMRMELRMNAAVVRAFNEATENVLRGKPKLGERATIVESLLRNWLVANGYGTRLAELTKEIEDAGR